MKYVLIKTGHASIEAARVCGEREVKLPNGRIPRVLSCRRCETGSDDEFEESKPFDVYVPQVMAEYTDEHPTNDEHLNYQAALMNLLRAYVTRSL